MKTPKPLSGEVDNITIAIDKALAEPIITPSDLHRLDCIHTTEFQLFQNVLKGNLSYDEAAVALAMYINFIDGKSTEPQVQVYLGQLALNVTPPEVVVESPLL